MPFAAWDIDSFRLSGTKLQWQVHIVVQLIECALYLYQYIIYVYTKAIHLGQNPAIKTHTQLVGLHFRWYFQISILFSDRLASPWVQVLSQSPSLIPSPSLSLWYQIQSPISKSVFKNKFLLPTHHQGKKRREGFQVMGQVWVNDKKNNQVKSESSHQYNLSSTWQQVLWFKSPSLIIFHGESLLLA